MACYENLQKTAAEKFVHIDKTFWCYMQTTVSKNKNRKVISAL